MPARHAHLVLADGTIIEGSSCSISGKVSGEVVFHTGVVGYQEILTDPVYAGQIVVLTYPLIGNYGVNDEDWESDSIWPQALIIREISPIFSNFRATGSFADFLKENNILCIKDVDTRALAIHLREQGEMVGILSSEGTDPDKLREEVKSISSPYRQNLVERTTCKRITEDKDKLRYRVAVVDLGVQNSLLVQLRELGCSLIRLPSTTPADKITRLNADGILITSGPGDPQQMGDLIEQVKSLLGKLPILGIGLGHQVLAIAGGARTFRMKLGHRGVNLPVTEKGKERSLITAQHHSFCVEESSLPQGLQVTHRHLNDGTVEGISFGEIPAFSIQFYPGRDEFDRPSESLQKFVKLMEANKNAKAN